MKLAEEPRRPCGACLASKHYECAGTGTRPCGCAQRSHQPILSPDPERATEKTKKRRTA